MENPAVTQEDRLKIAAGFIAQAPPGELNDVLNDVTVLFNDDEALQASITKALATYNKEQLATLPVPWGEHKTVLCEAALLENGRFVDPRGKKTFAIDHVTLAVSEPEDLESTEHDAAREALEAQLDAYIKSHYPNGVGAVFYREGRFEIVIVDSKYKPENYWNGRWRSQWTWFDGKLTGTSRALVHYFEDGNVQLVLNKDFDLEMPETSTPEAVFQAIRKAENAQHRATNETFPTLSENAFKNLRRALPLTKTKVDWNKIANYKVGAELAGNAENGIIELVQRVQRHASRLETLRDEEQVLDRAIRDLSTLSRLAHAIRSPSSNAAEWDLSVTPVLCWDVPVPPEWLQQLPLLVTPSLSFLLHEEGTAVDLAVPWAATCVDLLHFAVAEAYDLALPSETWISEAHLEAQLDHLRGPRAKLPPRPPPSSSLYRGSLSIMADPSSWGRVLSTLLADGVAGSTLVSGPTVTFYVPLWDRTWPAAPCRVTLTAETPGTKSASEGEGRRRTCRLSITASTQVGLLAVKAAVVARLADLAVGDDDEVKASDEAPRRDGLAALATRLELTTLAREVDCTDPLTERSLANVLRSAADSVQATEARVGPLPCPRLDPPG
ncbi:F-actin-capping protein subunit alpha [Blastocladiella emersonii ATCC 22665]|nr:F-actin-capping protein subunit alpha [Blastocladiella emersonii ATCC 22665]